MKTQKQNDGQNVPSPEGNSANHGRSNAELARFAREVAALTLAHFLAQMAVKALGLH